jgi:Na+/proline symporter
MIEDLFDQTTTIIGFWGCLALAGAALAVQHRRYVPGNPSLVPWTSLFVAGFLGAILFGLHWLRLSGTIGS